MTILEVFLLSLALAADAFSVGTAVGLKHREPRQIFRLSFHFGLFQSLMSLAGFAAGSVFIHLISAWDHWLAFFLLGFIGVRMIISALAEDQSRSEIDLTKGFSLVGLSLAVSIDALAAGVGLAAVNVSAGMAISTIGIVSALATLTAMLIADKVGQKLGKYSELIAGIVLILLGVRILITG
jgi:manganese efflux pump family protein